LLLAFLAGVVCVEDPVVVGDVTVFEPEVAVV
jgi:hypothetical protein